MSHRASRSRRAAKVTAKTAPPADERSKSSSERTPSPATATKRFVEWAEGRNLMLALIGVHFGIAALLMTAIANFKEGVLLVLGALVLADHLLCMLAEYAE